MESCQECLWGRRSGGKGDWWSLGWIYAGEPPGSCNGIPIQAVLSLDIFHQSPFVLLDATSFLVHQVFKVSIQLSRICSTLYSLNPSCITIEGGSFWMHSVMVSTLYGLSKVTEKTRWTHPKDEGSLSLYEHHRTRLCHLLLWWEKSLLHLLPQSSWRQSHSGFLGAIP